MRSEEVGVGVRCLVFDGQCPVASVRCSVFGGDGRWRMGKEDLVQKVPASRIGSGDVGCSKGEDESGRSKERSWSVPCFRLQDPGTYTYIKQSSKTSYSIFFLCIRFTYIL